jgi:hypothetical protein
VRSFETKVGELNRRVRTYNLIAPTAAAVMQTISVQRELEDVREGRTVFDERALRELGDDDGTVVRLTAAASLPHGAEYVPPPGDWASGIALAPLDKGAFSLSKEALPAWRDVAGGASLGLGSAVWPGWRDFVTAFRL